MSKVVLLDVDGLLADYTTGWIRAYHLCGGDPVTPAMITTWEHEDSVPRGKELAPLIRQFIKAPGFALELSPYPGAIEAVQKLSSIADVYFVTAPFEGSRTWPVDREDWLVKHFDARREQVIHARDKTRVDGDIFVDDRIENVRAWSYAYPGKRGVLWSRPHNAECTDLFRTNDWSVIFDAAS